jgi:chemotaxis protein CheX
MLQDFELHFNRAVCEVFTTMLRYQLETASAEGWRMDGRPHLAGCIGFFGKLNGVVYIYTAEPFARHIASRLLGMRESEIDSDELVNDAIGELTNMVVGPVKSRLTDHGAQCVLTIPSIVRGTNFTIETSSETDRRRFGFRCNEGELFAEVLIKNRETTNH